MNDYETETVLHTLEPRPWRGHRADYEDETDYTRVDFDNDEGGTDLTMRATIETDPAGRADSRITLYLGGFDGIIHVESVDPVHVEIGDGASHAEAIDTAIGNAEIALAEYSDLSEADGTAGGPSASEWQRADDTVREALAALVAALGGAA